MRTSITQEVSTELSELTTELMGKTFPFYGMTNAEQLALIKVLRTAREHQRQASQMQTVAMVLHGIERRLENIEDILQPDPRKFK